MDSISWVSTSLDLNSNPLRLNDHELPATTGALVEELNRVSAENKKLTEMLTEMCENYNALRNQLRDYMKNKDSNNPENKEMLAGASNPKKRKYESSSNNNFTLTMGNHSETSSTDEETCKQKQQPREEPIKAKVSRVHYRTEASDTSLVVKDGYQWRKYGQKVTRDNPSPRAYFKCSYAPICPVKKKVQRSVEDQSVVVATYEGEHNHPIASRMEAAAPGSSRGVTTLGSSGRTITLDLPGSNKSCTEGHRVETRPRVDAAPEVRKFLVEQMASSLTKDPNFTMALAAAISGQTFQRNPTEKW